MSDPSGADREGLRTLEPLLRRAVDLDPRILARLRMDGMRAVLLVRLPFEILVSQATPASRSEPLDVVMRAADALAWLDGTAERPEPRDHEWRWGAPPDAGWQRLETVPDDVIRPLVRQGALTLKEAAAREGVPGAQPRAEVADALLDSTVLTVERDGVEAQVNLRALSALTRMGFLPRGGAAHVELRGRWIRVVALYGSVYLERPGGLSLV
ncbi:hypothetical protein [Jatrophihabitans fulvus]